MSTNAYTLPNPAAEAPMMWQDNQGRSEVFQQMLEPHLRALKRWLTVLTRNDVDAEDLMQDVILKAYINLHRFRFEATFRTWLMRIAFNEVMQKRRSVWHKRTQALEPADLERFATPESGSPFAQVERDEAKQRLRAAISELGEIDRTVIELRDLNGLSVADAARKLKVSVSAAKTRHHRARQRLTHILKHANERPVLEAVS